LNNYQLSAKNYTMTEEENLKENSSESGTDSENEVTPNRGPEAPKNVQLAALLNFSGFILFSWLRTSLP
tara:strand:+ start:385 stop:591 length:207 start_codon:yes stop_codon:yes gene_type:complete